MSANITHGFLGYQVMRKTSSGGGSIAQDAEIVVPYIRAGEVSPSNDQYVPMVNKSDGLSTIVRGLATPSCDLVTCAKGSWFTAAWVSCQIIAVDSNFDVDTWAFKRVEDDGTVIIEGARCVGLSISWQNNGTSPIMVNSSYLCKTLTGSQSFTSTGSIDAGDMLTSYSSDYGSGPSATLCEGGTINILRPAAYEYYTVKQVAPSNINSFMIGGTVSLRQSVRAATVPSSSLSLRLYTGVPGAQTLLMTFTIDLNLDVAPRTRSVGPGIVERTYTMIDNAAGGVPVAVA